MSTRPTLIDGVTAAAVLAVGLSLCLMILRVASSVSLDEPLLVSTSGAEQESSYALWKRVRGRDVYGDPRLIPFAASYYNWLFYESYGRVVTAVLALGRMPEAWLPTIARLVTLIGAAVGTFIFWRTFRLAAGTRTPPGLATSAMLFALFYFAGPLVGFWIISINPELAATVLTIGAAWTLIAWYDAKPDAAVCAASLLSVVAWSFKQNVVFAAGAMALFLLLRRDWRGLLIVAAVHALAFGAAFGLGSSIYRKMLLFSETSVEFELSTLLRNLLNLALKTMPVFAALLIGIWRVVRARGSWRAALRETAVAYALAGFLVAAIATVPASAKVGAAENYYFAPVGFALLVFFATQRLETGRLVPRTLTAIFGLSWLAQGAAVAAMLAGYGGVISVRGTHEMLRAQKACLAEEAAPLLTHGSLYLPLPWITPQEPHFVLAYNYGPDRAAGRPFAGGGLGGLVAAGYFATVAIAIEADTTIEGAALDRYRLANENCAGLRIFRRREDR